MGKKILDPVQGREGLSLLSEVPEKGEAWRSSKFYLDVYNPELRNDKQNVLNWNKGILMLFEKLLTLYLKEERKKLIYKLLVDKTRTMGRRINFSSSVVCF